MLDFGPGTTSRWLDAGQRQVASGD